MFGSVIAIALGLLLAGPVAAEPDARGARPESEEGHPLRRRLPGVRPPVPEGYRAPAPSNPHDIVAVPDRWRIVETLGVHERWWDPYHQNTLKGDRPIFGQDWFLNLIAISDSVLEPRRIPTPVGLQGTGGGGKLDVFGDGEQLLANQNLVVSASLIQGDTVFRPPDWELRVTAVQNWNYTVAEVLGFTHADPSRGRRRFDHHFSLQDLFVDRHLRNRSERYDFDSLRVGIQPFISDFRGFVFQDNQPGVRLFGTIDNNRIQYNLAWFRRLEKDTNSGLNELFELRADDVILANVYRQDFPVLGFTLQGTAIYNRNREGDRHRHRNSNAFQQRPAALGDQRPRNYDVFYFGLNGDGHFGRANLTFAAYWLTGSESHNPIAGKGTDVNAGFLAAEASRDFDWYRLKAFALWASGDREPFDGRANGFDGIFENPQFAGAEGSFWQRQAIPFIGGGGVILSGRNALLPSLRASKEEGQSNFVQPGLRLFGIGADLDLRPELRLALNASTLEFDDTATLEVLRNQSGIDRHIGEDLSLSLIYRPLFTQNVVLRLSAAALFPGDGFRALFDEDKGSPFYSVLASAVLTY